MSELEEKISAILSDPGEMSKLTRMARSLFGEAEPPSPARESPEDAPPFPDPGMLSAVGRMLSGAESGGGNSQKLLEAMKPYLGEKRREKMEKAMRIARMARMAKLAMGEMEGKGDGL